MMAKKENFDFETEDKFKLDFSFFKNLTQKQKETILMIAIAVVAVIVIVVIGLLVLTGGNGNNNSNGNVGGNTGSNSSSEKGEEDNTSGGEGTMPDEISVLQISLLPTKTVYYVGDEPNYDGLYVYIRDGNGESKYIYYVNDPDAFTFSGFDSSAPTEKQVITVECRGLTDTFTVEILPAPESDANLVGISMKTLPRTKFYIVNGRLEAFNPEGGVILAEYDDGTTKEIDLQISNVSGYSFITAAGEYTLTIKFFDDHGGYAETALTITVVEYS